jgi:hypothetical protein
MIAMRHMRHLLLLLCVVCASAAVTWAQDSAEQLPVVNKDIAEMVKAGVSADVVIAKIKTSFCQFDTSPPALVSLKEAGVPDAVLLEMVRNPHGMQPAVERAPARPTPPAEPPPREQSKAPSDGLPEYGDISEIRRMHRVYVVADDIDSQSTLINSLRQYGGLQIVGSPDRAEVFITFGQGTSATAIQLRGLFAGTIDHRTKAQFIVFYRSENGRPRIVWQETEDIQTSSGITFSRPNEVNVSRHFVKALRKVRGEVE